MRKKRRNRYSAHKIMLVGIGVLSIVLMTVLIMKAYQFHQEKLQMEEWQVRHDEVPGIGKICPKAEMPFWYRNRSRYSPSPLPNLNSLLWNQ